jgi:hypothetical protein
MHNKSTINALFYSSLNHEICSHFSWIPDPSTHVNPDPGTSLRFDQFYSVFSIQLRIQIQGIRILMQGF